ncbi:MAG: hypothetical protein M1825_000421 [Sarcosagium campestre]|nr:MAG: hypothetical protein M1825_000421 [Sarcosagium campestre]
MASGTARVTRARARAERREVSPIEHTQESRTGSPLGNQSMPNSEQESNDQVSSQLMRENAESTLIQDGGFAVVNNFIRDSSPKSNRRKRKALPTTSDLLKHKKRSREPGTEREARIQVTEATDTAVPISGVPATNPIVAQRAKKGSSKAEKERTKQAEKEKAKQEEKKRMQRLKQDGEDRAKRERENQARTEEWRKNRQAEEWEMNRQAEEWKKNQQAEKERRWQQVKAEIMEKREQAEGSQVGIGRKPYKDLERYEIDGEGVAFERLNLFPHAKGSRRKVKAWTDDELTKLVWGLEHFTGRHRWEEISTRLGQPGQALQNRDFDEICRKAIEFKVEVVAQHAKEKCRTPLPDWLLSIRYL